MHHVLITDRNSVDKRTLIENYDLASLCIDEIVDDGIILETDPVVIASRVSRPPVQDMPNMQGIDLKRKVCLSMRTVRAWSTEGMGLPRSLDWRPLTIFASLDCVCACCV